MKRYYTLAEKTGGKWAPQFGDYDRAVVNQEKQDWLDSDENAVLKIIVTSDSQYDIEQAIIDLNRG